MSTSVTTFLFEVLNFLLLAAVLAWLFFRPVRDALDRRRAEQQRLAAETARKLAEAERKEAEIQKRYEELEREVQQRRDELLSAAQDEASRLIQAARDAARREADAAKRRLSHLEQSQSERLARAIATTTAASVDRLLRQIAEQDLDHWLAKAAAQQLQMLDRDALVSVRIESARPLSESDQRVLVEALGPKKPPTDFHVIDDLVAGVRIATGDGLIDASAIGLASYAERELVRILTADSSAEHEPNDG